MSGIYESKLAQKPTQEQKDAAEKLKDEKFDWLTVADFLCRHFNVRDVPFIDPFVKHRVNAWEVLNVTVLGAEINKDLSFYIDPTKKMDFDGQAVNVGLGEENVVNLLTDPQPRQPFIHPNTGKPMPSDLENVYIYSIACRKYSHNLPVSIAPRLNYYPRGMSELQEMQERDGIIKAAGGIGGGFTQLEPTNGESRDLQTVPMPELSFAYQNRYFVRTWSLIDETNIRNGLVVIPPEVCARAGLPLQKTSKIEAPEDLILTQFKMMKIEDITSEEANKVRQEVNDRHREDVLKGLKNVEPIEFYYAVPINHVLAWGYTSEDYMMERKHCAYKFKYVPPVEENGKNPIPDPIVLFFLVPNTLIEANIKSALEYMVKKSDKQSIKRVGFEFMPNPTKAQLPSEPTPCQGQLMLRTYISYYSGPKLQPATIANLAPTTCPNFPLCREWSREELAKNQAIEQYYRETGKTNQRLK
jgi:hypothetical protein